MRKTWSPYHLTPCPLLISVPSFLRSPVPTTCACVSVSCLPVVCHYLVVTCLPVSRLRSPVCLQCAQERKSVRFVRMVAACSPLSYLKVCCSYFVPVCNSYTLAGFATGCCKLAEVPLSAIGCPFWTFNSTKIGSLFYSIAIFVYLLRFIYNKNLF